VFEVAFGGLITIPAAFVFLGAGATAGGTFGLGFNTLPVVFAHMGSAGWLVGATWFLLLFLAAITSSLSMLQPVLAFLQEALGMPRLRALVALAIATLAGSLWVVWFSRDLAALDTMDFWVGTMFIFVLATVEIICFAWVFGVERGLAEANAGAQVRIPRVFGFVMKYVSPAYLVVVFAGFCWQSLPAYVRGLATADVARWTMGVIGVFLALLLFLLRMGEQRWRELGLDLDGVGDGRVAARRSPA
jgi:SNF family Na+-dependent transporter